MADKQMTSLTSLTAAASSSSANNHNGGRARSVNRLSAAETAKHAIGKQKATGSGQRTASTSRIQSSSRSKMASRPPISAEAAGSLHSSATSLNRMSKNDDDVEEQYKMADLSAAKKTQRNRWSVHGQAMNNSTSAPTATPVSAPVPKQNGGKFKMVNKLNSSSARVAVRPTQAIKPLNQYVEEKSSVISSPSFNQTFDLETTEFKSITAHKLLKGISVNSIDTLVEVNMLATDIDKTKPAVDDDPIEDEKMKSKMADAQLQQQQIAQA